MQKRIWGLTASMLALTCLTVTGCGSQIQSHFQSTTSNSSGQNKIATQSGNTTSLKTKAHLKKSTSLPSNVMNSKYSDNNNMNTLSATELANYANTHGPMPFNSKNIHRSVPNQNLSIFGSYIVTKNNSKFNSNSFKMVDFWNGTLKEQVFALEIAKQTGGSKYIVGLDYGKKSEAFVFPNRIWITNFTGDYVVFYVPSPAQGNPVYALNLYNGTLLPNQTVSSNMVKEMSGIRMGGYSLEIAGLSKSYPVFQ
ncbi:hypothetical protein ACOJUR_08775 [Alicyclobacillus tolerans]|uniref:hypothetical protein n=1 Tax=Alicyclobacillus tolerans TaxID=90970 RepID=UPI003B7A7CCE